MPGSRTIPTNPPHYQRLADHYEACLRQHGDCARGVDWPDERSARIRYDVMADLIRNSRGSLLDFGCGAGHFLEHLLAQRIDVDYRGLDISRTFVDLCRSKFPGHTFDCMDVLAGGNKMPAADFIVMNGVLTEKLTLSHADMTQFMHALLRVVFPAARQGIAFNLMSKHVDWEREDLFHVGHDEIGRFVSAELSRHYVIRADYGLYEYTVYVYHSPNTSWRRAWQMS